MHPRETFPQTTALGGSRLFRRESIKERHDHRGPSLERAERFAVFREDGLRAGEALARQMLFQANEIGQVIRIHPFFEQGKNEPARRGFEIVVRILDAFGNALERQGIAEIVFVEKRRQRVV